MNTANTFPVITIGREYGAGGRSVARALSEILDIPWYDKDLVKLAAEESGYSVENIMAEGEELKSSSKLLDKILNSANSYTSSHDAIFRAQKEAILELAKEPCIIVGRCANIILAEAGIKSFDVYLYADMDARIQRAKELAENGSMDLRKYVEQRDALRETYYKTYTKRDLGNYHDYDMLLNTSKLGMTKCARMIADSVR